MEGSPGSQLIQLIRKHGYNKDVDIELATVTAAPPALRVKIDGMKIELEADDFVVAQSVTERTETHRYSDGTTRDVTIQNALKAGDRVIVASIKNGQLYVILDRMVTY